MKSSRRFHAGGFFKERNHMKGGTRKRGKTWSYYFDMGKINGKRKKKEKGGFPTKKEAEAALARSLDEYNNTGTIFAPADITVSDYLDQWFEMDVRTNRKYNTQANYRAVIDNHLRPRFGEYRLRALTPAAVQEYANDLKRQGYAKATLKKIITTLSAALEYAIEPLGYIQYNPCDRVKYPRYEEGRPELHHFISRTDMQKILARFPVSSPFYVPIMIGYYTGVRISECFGLTWDRIDLKSQTITVDRQIVKKNLNGTKNSWYFQTPKSASSVRVIRYGDTLQKVLKTAYRDKQKNRLELGGYFMEYYQKPEMDASGSTSLRLLGVSRDVPVDLEKADLVCVRPDGVMITTDSFKYVCRVAQHDLGIPFNYHSLRHTHATMLIEAGAPIKDVQVRLGHADVETTINRYVHDTEEMKNETVEIFERISGLA